jgi:hypothetical protein
MKRGILWSILFLAGVVVWWGSQVPAMAGYSPNHYIGLPFDGDQGGLVRDHSPERSGWDRHSDRDPDGDSAGSADDREHDNKPDCRNATGDGIGFVVGFMGAGGNLNAGPCGSWGEGGDGTPFADDLKPERPNKGPGDFISDSVPDRHTAPGFNRIGDKYYDEDPDNKCPGSSALTGDCERTNTKEVRDYITDNTPDAPTEGPNDHTSDNYLAMMGTVVVAEVAAAAAWSPAKRPIRPRASPTCWCFSSRRRSS